MTLSWEHMRAEIRLNFYRNQVSRYGEPVLELASGSGRFTIPLAKGGVNITGMDISEEMLQLAKSKAFKEGVNIRVIQDDMRRFDLGEKFKFIFIPAQSLSHLHTREDIEDCFSCVRQHLADEGRFLIEVFNSSVSMLARNQVIAILSVSTMTQKEILRFLLLKR